MPSLHFFDKGSPYLAHPLLTVERTALEVDCVETALGLSPPARVLDIGCGFGRHSIELAKRGYAVTAIDPAAAMIDAAREKAAEAGVTVDFRRERGQDFIAEFPFDAAICLFTTLGQIMQEHDNSGLLRRAYNALKPGGKLLVEVPQRDPAVRSLKSSEVFGDDTRYTKVARAFDPASSTISEMFRLVTPQKSRTYHLKYRLYSRPELFSLLQDAGFAISAAYGSYDRRPLADDSPVMLVVGEKA